MEEKCILVRKLYPGESDRVDRAAPGEEGRQAPETSRVHKQIQVRVDKMTKPNPS